VTNRARPTITISCDDCPLRHTDACDDCLVSFVLSRDPDDGIVVDVAEARAMRVLHDAGLVPEMRHPGAAVDWAAC
jgi:hypothetical protein